jgi:hypothetical protein
MYPVVEKDIRINASSRKGRIFFITMPAGYYCSTYYLLCHICLKYPAVEGMGKDIYGSYIKQVIYCRILMVVFHISLIYPVVEVKGKGIFMAAISYRILMLLIPFVSHLSHIQL